ncbi:MAG: PAS domain-containing protein, partial [Candidatus Limnocylindrales bacterium]
MTSREAGPRFRALVENIPGAVYRRGAEPPWLFQYISDTIESIAGYRARDLMTPGALVDGLLPIPEDLSPVTDEISGA